jgi:hypothetical protein
VRAAQRFRQKERTMNNGVRTRGRQTQSYGLQQFAFVGATSAAIAAALVVIPVVLIGVLMDNQGLIYCGLCVMAFLIPLYVGLRRGAEFDLFEPINLVAFAVLFGSTLRAVWLLLSDSSRVGFIMMGTTFDEVLANMPLILLSLLAFTIGYALFPTRLRLEKMAFFRDYALGRQRFWFAVCLAGGISLIGIPWMIIEYGISFDAGILAASQKRVVAYLNDSGEIVYGSGFQRFLAFGAVHGFSLIAAAVLARRLRMNAGIVFAVIVLAAMSIVTPFLTSNRSSFVLILLNLLIFGYYYKRVSLRSLLIALGISLFVLSTLGVVRQVNQTGAASDDMSAVDRILGSGNSLDFVRTSAIIDRVPDYAPFLRGQTYAALFTGVIPRAVWPDKPDVRLGGFVKNVIFGEESPGGWPSGMIGEGWINFGILGLFLPLFAFGVFLRFIYESVRPHLGVSFPITLIYAVSIWRLGFGTIGLNFAQGMIQTLSYAGPIIFLLIIARAPTGFRAAAKRSPATGRPPIA